MSEEIAEVSPGQLGRKFRDEKFALREEIDGVMVATHLPPEKHGKDTTYVSYGCRCDACSKAHREKAKEYRERKRREREAKEKAKKEAAQ